MDTDMGTPETQPRKPVWDIISSSSSLAPARSTASRLGTALPLARWRDCEGGGDRFGCLDPPAFGPRTRVHPGEGPLVEQAVEHLGRSRDVLLSAFFYRDGQG